MNPLKKKGGVAPRIVGRRHGRLKGVGFLMGLHQQVKDRTFLASAAKIHAP